jgi:hypothetical protein
VLQVVGSQLQANMDNFSPGKRIPFDTKSQNTVARLVWREWKGILVERGPGVAVDYTEGSSQIKLLERHNDP